VRLLIRSWNVFHGNADPPRRRGYLRAMVELASADEPDVLCLQEVPIWAIPRLDGWSGMRAEAAVARLPLVPAPLPSLVTRLHQGLFRSALAGQANAVLVAREHATSDLGKVRISEPGRERRVCQAVRVAGAVLVANLHASNELDRPEIPAAELERARAFAEALARPDEPVVLAGDFNLLAPRLAGYSEPGPGIDHVLVRGLPATPLAVWPRERRAQNGVVLSDHAPVELTLSPEEGEGG
jgi:endonuclease/exonuclease/phosphatase family metal-dependent hydrolase